MSETALSDAAPATASPDAADPVEKDADDLQAIRLIRQAVERHAPKLTPEGREYVKGFVTRMLGST